LDRPHREATEPPSCEADLQDVKPCPESDASGHAERLHEPKADAVESDDTERALREVRRETHPAERSDCLRQPGWPIPEQQRHRGNVERRQRELPHAECEA